MTPTDGFVIDTGNLRGMDHVRWASRPQVRRPIVIVAFEGWNDAGDGASGAARWMAQHWATVPLATLDPEEFYDFTSTRPEVRIDNDRQRVIDWPGVTLMQGSDSGADIVVVLGIEPQLRWRTFCAQLVEVSKRLGAQLVITMGALLADIPHTRDTSVIATSDQQPVIDRLGVQRSGYEGPTGIIGVLNQAVTFADIACVSLWAAVPAYIPAAPSPKAALALVRRCAELIGVSVVTTDLEIAAAAYERQVNEAMEEDEDIRTYIQELEERYTPVEELEVPRPDLLVEEVERFLREQ